MLGRDIVKMSQKSDHPIYYLENRVKLMYMQRNAKYTNSTILYQVKRTQKPY